jgi:hypothetical protein
MIALEPESQNRRGFGDLRTITFVQFMCFAAGAIIPGPANKATTMQNTQPTTQFYDDDEIDLRQLVATLCRQKALVASIGLLGGALGLGASVMSTQYVVEGLFLTPGATASADYKRYEGVLTNGPRLHQYLQISNQVATFDGQLLVALAQEPGKLADTLKPEFAFTDRDSKAFGVKINADDPDAMLGIRIQFAHKEPTSGTPVTLLAEYVRDSIIRVNLEATTLDQCNAFRTREQELRNKQIQNHFDTRQEESRADKLREIIARNPDTSATDNRQIVSLEKGTERFLSPAAQLVASEIKIADMKLAEASRERERTASALKRDYYCQAQQALTQPTTGKAFLNELKNIQAAVFQGQDKSIDIVEQTWNELDVQRENWASTYLSRMRFVASPEGTEVKERKPGVALGLVLGGMLGGMFGVMVASVRAWWRGNRDEITTTSKS